MTCTYVYMHAIELYHVQSHCLTMYYTISDCNVANVFLIVPKLMRCGCEHLVKPCKDSYECLQQLVWSCIECSWAKIIKTQHIASKGKMFACMGYFFFLGPRPGGETSVVKNTNQESKQVSRKDAWKILKCFSSKLCPTSSSNGMPHALAYRCCCSHTRHVTEH